ncbi:cerebral cavernous malformations protein 2 homolog isoform X2 [Saccostrea echinata]|uniref:cerebral cavernous malformations protein 2 homolog isoform X2 n=1 Tax=Saccostrea echinata TaxID=191078 RepID=UPI002A838A01|nr:cerebral cavernous malformations protein 2 homolog isoform X2 [Saccostrea echinata]
MEIGEWYNLDSMDGRRRQQSHYEVGNESRNSTGYNLHSDYHKDSDHTEYQVQFAGIIEDIQVHVDITNRTEVLRMIDRGKMDKMIPLVLSVDRKAILSLCRYNMKLMYREHGTENLIIRIPIHEIAAVCYVNDDGIHILAIKYGNPERCSLLVLYCDSPARAERVCSDVAQCFQLIYTDAVVKLLEDAICKVENSSTGSPTINDNSRKYSLDSQDNPGISQSHPNLAEQRHRDSGSVHSMHSGHSVQTELLRSYLEQLRNKFTVDELAKFSTLLKKINDPSPKKSSELQAVFQEVYQLYGKERKNLLTGLCPFIYEKHYDKFLDFLKKQGIVIPDNGTLSSRHSYPRIYTRSVSDMTTNDQSDIDSVLEGISSQLAQIDSNIGDVPAYLSYPT